MELSDFFSHKSSVCVGLFFCLSDLSMVLLCVHSTTVEISYSRSLQHQVQDKTGNENWIVNTALLAITPETTRGLQSPLCRNIAANVARIKTDFYPIVEKKRETQKLWCCVSRFTSVSDSRCWLLLLPVIIWSSISMSLPPLCWVSLLSLLSGLTAGEPGGTGTRAA